jgi:arginine-tRNA-protein transferase
MRAESAKLLLFATPSHVCSYLPENHATTVFVDPEYPKDSSIYTLLSQNGFRRSGEHVYRPNCPACDACVPLRVPVARFSPRRRQRRIWRMNESLRVNVCTNEFRDEHFALYRRYQSARHPGGGMDNPTHKQYREFLLSSWAETRLYEFREGEQLLAVAVADRLNDGLSAVYSFFDPDLPRRSLGTYCILWQIREASRLGLDWLYLGYWIADSPKMAYKQDFLPQERLVDGRWQLCR